VLLESLAKLHDGVILVRQVVLLLLNGLVALF